MKSSTYSIFALLGGSIGLHNFYEKNYKVAIWQLCSTLGSALIGFILSILIVIFACCNMPIMVSNILGVIAAAGFASYSVLSIVYEICAIIKAIRKSHELDC